MQKSRIAATCAVAIAVFATAFPHLPTATAAEPLKVGFIYPSPLGDAGWTYRHDQGRLALEAALGDKVTTSYVEDVKEGADAERVIRRLASNGHKMIVTTSFGYMNPTLKAAKSFPNVAFVHISGYKRSTNVSTLFVRAYEGRFLAGIVAGRMTRSNVLGMVAAHPIPEVIRGINAFALGARNVNPEISVRVIWTNSWHDPAKERQAAETLIAQGVDVLSFHADSAAVVQTAEAKGAHVIAYHSDMKKYGPAAHLTAVVSNWGPSYVKAAKAVLAGNWKSSDAWLGIAAGMVDLAPFAAKVPQDVRRQVATAKAEIASGSLHPFQGPVRDQSGRIRVAEGQQMSDSDMLSMGYYVDAVVSKLPNK